MTDPDVPPGMRPATGLDIVAATLLLAGRLSVQVVEAHPENRTPATPAELSRVVGLVPLGQPGHEGLVLVPFLAPGERVDFLELAADQLNRADAIGLIARAAVLHRELVHVLAAIGAAMAAPEPEELSAGDE